MKTPGRVCRKRSLRGPSILLWAALLALTAAACGSSSATTTAVSTKAAVNSAHAGNPALQAINKGNAVDASVRLDPAARALLPASVRQKNSLNFYIGIPYEPLDMFVPGTTTPSGLDDQLAVALSKALGVRLNTTNVQFPQLFTGLQSHRADFDMAGISDNVSRRKLYTFIDYFESGDIFQTSTVDAAKYHITDGLASMCGKTVVTGVGSAFPKDVRTMSGILCTSKGKPAIHQLLTASLSEAEIDVEDGRAQGIVNQGPEGFYWLQRTSPHGQTTSGPVYLPSDYGIMFLKGSPLVPAFFKAMQDLKRDGVYHRLFAAYGLTVDQVPKIGINAGPCECTADLYLHQ